MLTKVNNKWFLLYWLGGSTEYLCGGDIGEAFNKARYGAGASKALDYHEEVTELPLDKKEVYLVSDSSIERIFSGTMFYNQLMNGIKSGKSMIEIMICNKIWNVSVEISEFIISLTNQ